MTGALTMSAMANTTIDPNGVDQAYGWFENAGWLDLRGDETSGVVVGENVLSGFAWSENVGWINFGDGSPANGVYYSNTVAGDFGVNRDSFGNLSGYAWGENIGWIAMDTLSSGGARVSIESATGRFAGYAWSENIGWLNFETVPLNIVAHTQLMINQPRNVAKLITKIGTLVTIISPEGTVIEHATLKDPNLLIPQGVTFPEGLIDLEISGGPIGGTIPVTITYEKPVLGPDYTDFYVPKGDSYGPINPPATINENGTKVTVTLQLAD